MAIAQWDFRTRFDSLGNPISRFYFPKCILIKKNTLYICRYPKGRPGNFYNKNEYGEGLGNVPEELHIKIAMIDPVRFDTVYSPNKNMIYDGLHYALVDLKTNKCSLFIPHNIDGSTFQTIKQLFRYADTTQIRVSADTGDLFFIRNSIEQTVRRHALH